MRACFCMSCRRFSGVPICLWRIGTDTSNTMSRFGDQPPLTRGPIAHLRRFIGEVEVVVDGPTVAGYRSRPRREDLVNKAAVEMS